MMHKDGQNIVVRHREFLTEVTASTTFNVLKSFPINPGMAITFPWLSKVARNFQQYRIRGMVYHYIPTSGNMSSSGNPALGSVMLQTVYRATDSPPSSKVELLNEYWTGEVVPSETLAHPVECNPKENPYNVQYVRSFDPPSGESRLLYDLGTTYLAVNGQQTAGVTLGDLWVTYEVELLKPLVTSDVITQDPYWGIQVVTPTNWFTGASIGASEGNITVTYGGDTMSLPLGMTGTIEYYMSFRGSGTTFGLTSAFTPVLTGCTLVGMVSVGTGIFMAPPGTTANYGTLRFRVQINSSSTVAKIAFPTLSGSAVSSGSLTWISHEICVRND
jgi:hypothetical protein